MYALYVIPGSHACRSGILMLEHKGVPYRRVDVPTLTHPLAVRLRGFDAGGQTRNAGGRRTVPIRLGDLLGTVPALACDRPRAPPNPLIADGVLGGEQLNAADFMVAPTVAMLLYRPDVRPFVAGRPALELVDRILPEPA